MEEFVKPQARPLPVIILADVSASMSGEPIDELNRAMIDMLENFKNISNYQADIQVCVICFGGDAGVHIPLDSAKNIYWKDMIATGNTPLGAALDVATALVQDKEAITSKSYRPICVLLSDGEPNDYGWQEKLQKFITTGRTQKIDRYALAIGDDADCKMLKEFINDEKKPVYKASDSSNIIDFFKLLTMSVAVRSKSVNPNDVSSDNPLISEKKGIVDVNDVKDRYDRDDF